MNRSNKRRNPRSLYWLPAIIFAVNLCTLGILFSYSTLNLRPFLPPHDPGSFQSFMSLVVFLLLLPTAASIVYLWPTFRWLRVSNGQRVDFPAASPVALERSANAPAITAIFTVAGWLSVVVATMLRIHVIFSDIGPALWIHFFVRPLLAGLIAATAVYFAAEFLCRSQVWPVIFDSRGIVPDRRVWKVRLLHRFIILWFTISFLPLSAVALTTYLRLESLNVPADSSHLQVVHAIILIAVSSALGGASLAWLLSRTMVLPLAMLETAMGRVRRGDFTARVEVGSTDEIGNLEGGFNQMAQQIEESYKLLEEKNKELTHALDRILYLEAVKRGLDRFVPDTVRRLIENNPEAPALQKSPKDVTVLFLDIQGYSALSEELPRPVLNGIIEDYFSIYLSDIRKAGGDINETAGDGLMILFQDGSTEHHVTSAVEVALAIREKTVARNRENEHKHPRLVVNMGISSGECDVGSTQLRGVAGERWTYTASGPVTNLAARLGDLARDGQILLSAEAAKRVRDRFHLHSLGLVQLKNMSQPEGAWAVERQRMELVRDPLEEGEELPPVSNGFTDASG